MTRIALCVSLISLPLLSAGLDLKSLLKNVETRYNRAQTLQVQFTETYAAQGRPRQSESGQLLLRKPGRMRWDYSLPAGKLFLSDGKNLFLYTPAFKRVERMPLKESDDMRAPLAFLLGKLDFNRDFRDLKISTDGGNYVISANPRSAKLPYDHVEMWIAPGYQIRRLVVNGQDKSVLTYEFDEEKLNPALKDGQFTFQMPPGATLVNSEIGQ